MVYASMGLKVVNLGQKTSKVGVWFQVSGSSVSSADKSDGKGEPIFRLRSGDTHCGNRSGIREQLCA